MSALSFSFLSMGTNWEVTIWDKIQSEKFQKIKQHIITSAEEFDRTYSRFIKNSLVRTMEQKTGIIEVPRDFNIMLSLYNKLYYDSQGKINPLIGHTISDLGYDESYSLTKKSQIRKIPKLDSAIQIIDETHIKKNIPFLLDFGALGKGHFIDLISLYLYTNNLTHFLVNGSGDMYYQGEKQITAGLEHPEDSKKIIGSIEITTGSLCASSTNRRKWGNTNHLIDATNILSETEILATWVYSDSCAISDGLATAFFFSPPENFLEDFKFEYLILNKDFKIKRSKGFNAVLY